MRWLAKWTRYFQALMEEEMRIAFDNIEQPKQMAKILSTSTKASLMKCQQALATASGYRDWFELSHAVSGPQLGKAAATLALDEKVDFSICVAQILDVFVGDVLFAMSQMNVFCWNLGLKEQLDISVRILRRTTIPDLGRRQPGSVGKFKNDGRPLILRSFGSLVSAVGHRSHDYGIADFEFVTPKNPLLLFIPGRLYYAYGAWTEADGSLVLHSRDYLPLWRLGNNKRPQRVNPTDWIDYVSARWFWDDLTAPWDNAKRHTEEITRLESYGVTGLPYLADTLPDIVFAPVALKPSDAAKRRFGGESIRRHD